MPGDHSVDPRALLDALVAACERAASCCGRAPRSRAWSSTARRVSGVELRGGELVAAGHVVVAAGAWSGALAGLPPDAASRCGPVKGQILRLRDPSGPGLLERVLRYEGGYVVPRGDGRYVARRDAGGARLRHAP